MSKEIGFVIAIVLGLLTLAIRNKWIKLPSLKKRGKDPKASQDPQRNESASADKKEDAKSKESQGASKKNWGWIKPLLIGAVILAVIYFATDSWQHGQLKEWKEARARKKLDAATTNVAVVSRKEFQVTSAGTERVVVDSVFCLNIQSLASVPYTLRYSHRGKVDSLMMPAKGSGPPLPWPVAWVELATSGDDKVGVVVLQTITEMK